MRRLGLLLVLVAWPALAAEEEPSWATGSWADGSWAAGSWGEDAAPTFPFTNVIGEANAAAAEAAFEADGFDIGVVTERCSAEAEDEVVGQDPSPGELVELGTLGNIRVSNGDECPAGRPQMPMRGLRMPGL